MRFIRSYVAVGREFPDTRNVTLRYATDAEGVREEEFDLVVLSVGLRPSVEARALAGRLGVSLDPAGFAESGAFAPAQTSRPGVFVAGDLAAFEQDGRPVPGVAPAA